MSLTETVLEGTIQADGTLVLDEKPNLAPGRVQVVLRQETVTKTTSDAFFQMMEEIWAGQKARDHVPRSEEEVETDRKEIRREMEHEIEDAIRLQEVCRLRRKRAESETSAP